MMAALLGTGLYSSIRLGFFQLRHPGLWLRRTIGSYRSGSGGPGAISQFQSMTTALAATVGTGNIAGVATAIALGGSLLVGGIVAGCLAGSHNKLPNPAQLARAYTGTNGVRLSRKEDNFVTTHTSRTAIPKSSSSGGGGGGSSTHSGSSGVSHGGGGRSF